jgi:lipopolysaccharide/colanic/teichoic acid biosynthesis glycosyltransferase
MFLVAKRAFDIAFSIFLLVPLGLISIGLLLLNPWLNPGPLFFVQLRMGKDCRAFKAIKFRTMTEGRVLRGADDPIETHRITPLGHVLRKLRFDELPQILNVLRGDMSLIGPRPDYFHHARVYLRKVPGYRDRHSVRPGISGLAQVVHGYVEGFGATERKVEADLRYIEESSLRLDLWIFWQTLCTVIGRRGA